MAGETVITVVGNLVDDPELRDPAEASNAKHASRQGAFERAGGKSATQTCIKQAAE
jgi:hypothetical protein